jgi:hypothetical protein
MNRARSLYDDELEQEQQDELRRAANRPNERVRQADYARRKRPTGYNGLHRRRNKRWNW